MSSVDSLRPSFRRHLRSRNLAATTVRIYDASVERFSKRIKEKPVTDIKSADIEDYMKWRIANASAASAVVDYRSLQAFWKWATNDGEVEVSPMARTSAPRVPLKRIPILPDESLAALLATCSNPRDLADTRDKAMILYFLDTGCRLAEVAGMRTDELKLDDELAIVTGKGSKTRAVVYSPRTADALDKYLRARARSGIDSPALWVGTKGALSTSGIAQMLARRSKEAGIDRVNPHAFRHTWAHKAHADNVSGVDMMTLAGWSSPQMLARYGASMREERAVAAARARFSRTR